MIGKPLIVGVTGGIGSGKTTVCKIFETLGAKTYYADDRAKWLMENDNGLIKDIKALFGDDAYNGGKLDRKYLASKAFQDDSVLEQLNSLVHPVVGRDVEEWISENKEAKLLLKEAALLFETGSYKSLDKTILVIAPEETRIQRVVSRDDHRSEQDVKNIMANQMKDEEKKPLADYIIANDGDQSVIKQVMKIYDKLIVA